MAKTDSPDPLALAKHAAVCWVEQAIKELYGVQRALVLASERHWGGQLYSASTLEGWLYTFRKERFSGLCRPTRQDKGTRKALSPEACEALLQGRRQHPQSTVQVLVRQLIQKGLLQSGAFWHVSARVLRKSWRSTSSWKMSSRRSPRLMTW